jgi:hypothetical protein
VPASSPLSHGAVGIPTLHAIGEEASHIFTRIIDRIGCELSSVYLSEHEAHHHGVSATR